MFSTSLATAALAGLLASGSLATQPAWQTDYKQALAQASQQQKPVAVFIARGGAGYDRLVTEGTLGADAARVLRSNYVCLYVDTQTTRGQTLAGAFQITEGLIISDKTGGVQALRHEGKVSRTNLTEYLNRHVESNGVTATEFHSTTQPVAAPATPVVQPAQPAVFAQPAPAIQPTYQPPAMYTPGMNFRNFSGGG